MTPLLKNFSLLFGLLLALSACRHPYQPSRAELCSRDKAEHVGYRHGLEGVDPLDNIAGVCLPQDQEVVEDAYYAAHAQGYAERIEAARLARCNYDYGYKEGVQHGQLELPVSTNLRAECTPEERALTESGYREGYAFGRENPLPKVSTTTNKGGRTFPIDATIEEVRIKEVKTTQDAYATPEVQLKTDDWTCLESYGEEACGYGCVAAYGEVVCGSEPGMECLDSYGETVCGYNCVAAYGEVVCASSPEMECVESYGDIVCGINCYASSGEILCDHYD